MLKEYLRLREIAEENNASLPSNHPCQRGIGRCCLTDVPISSDDKQVIMDGISSGDIPESVRVAAVANAKGSKKMCPFLNEHKECMVYDQRPLICIATGTLAIPRTQAAIDRMQDPRVGGLLFKDANTSMCRKCHKIEQRRERGINRQAFLDSQDIAKYYGGSNNTPMDVFVEQDLSK